MNNINSQGKLPNFIGLGTQKGGTTTLHRILEMHPNIYLPKFKEVHYFDNHYSKGIKWYKKNFSEAQNKQLCGEITPHYLYHPKVAIRIKNTIPCAKFIILLRDPIERTLSHFFHAQKRGFESLDIEEALNAEERRIEFGGSLSRQRYSYVGRSKYVEQINRYREAFREDQFLILKSETFFEEVNRSIDTIQDFLGIENMIKPTGIMHENMGSKTNLINVDKRIREKLRIILEETYRDVRSQYGITWED